MQSMPLAAVPCLAAEAAVHLATRASAALCADPLREVAIGGRWPHLHAVPEQARAPARFTAWRSVVAQ